MTLLRQLVIVIVTLFILLFVGTLLLSINNTRDYLNDQLRTISQDTATSLGLTLTPPMADKDMAVVDRMVSAVSDSGYYREVVVSDIEGKPLVSRKQDVKLGNVLVGEKTGALYWVDFERAALEGTPRYRERLTEHHGLVNRWFGLSLSGDGGA